MPQSGERWVKQEVAEAWREEALRLGDENDALKDEVLELRRLVDEYRQMHIRALQQ